MLDNWKMISRFLEPSGAIISPTTSRYLINTVLSDRFLKCRIWKKNQYLTIRFHPVTNLDIIKRGMINHMIHMFPPQRVSPQTAHAAVQVRGRSIVSLFFVPPRCHQVMWGSNDPILHASTQNGY